MEPETWSAPAVVATVVAHRPGPWFAEVVDSLAQQTYPNVKVLVLVADDPSEPATDDDGLTPDEIVALVAERLPSAYVRPLGANPGFGPAANEALRLVEGDSGLFCILHDDVALDPNAISELVEELYRSNAGMVGPKLVEWEQPDLLQHVGYDMDRFGELDALVEPGEVDQEQHDAVRDVFVLPSACLVVRADLFRALRGFDPTMTFYGEDRELSWRAHLSGARVLVVPSARARHRGRLRERRPDLAHRALQARHRMRSVAVLTGRWRQLTVMPLLVLMSLAEIVVGVFTGRDGSALAALRAIFGLLPRTGTILARRREVAPVRQVPEREVAGLQLRGSARVSAYLRARNSSTVVRDLGDRGARVREVGMAPLVAWVAVLALLLIGGRGIVGDGVRTVGEMLPFPDRPSDLLDAYRSGWWETGLGRSAASPTGLGLIGMGGVLLLGNMGLLQTLGVLGAIFVGYLGAWRLCSVFPHAVARAVGLVVYAAVPLPYAAVGAGRWQVLAVYASLPWSMHLLRRLAGLRDADLHEDDVTDVTTPVSTVTRVRVMASLVLLLAVAGAFAPSVLLVVPVAALVWLVATALARGAIAISVVALAGSVLAAVGAVLLNLPWSLRYADTGAWDAVVGPALAGPRDLGIVRIARFGIGPSTLGVLALALYLPVVTSLLLTRGWRLTWAARGALLVVGFGALAVLDDVGSLPLRLPEPGVLLVPVALGVALCAAVAAGAFTADVRGARFGWRQPLGLGALVAIGIGVLPGVAVTTSGVFDQPSISLADQLGELLPPDSTAGDYRVLLVGDPRLMPSASWSYDDGIATALHDDGSFDVSESWAGPDDTERRLLDEALTAISERSTARAGRLLAPLGIRYVVVPLVDRVTSSPSSPLPPPEGLLDALADQLDLRRSYSPTDMVLYENVASLPVRSVLSSSATDASREAGAQSLVRADLADSTPVLVGGDARTPVDGPVPAGSVHLSVSYDERWVLEVDGVAVEPRRSFGATMVYDVDAPGAASLSYQEPTSRTVVLVAQLLVWLAVLAVALGLPWARFWRRRIRRGAAVAPADAPVIALDSSAPPGDAVVAGDGEVSS